MDSIAVMLIYADNFDEVMETIEEIRRPVMAALVERRLNLLARSMDAVFRKFEKDKFLIVSTSEQIEAQKARNFDILAHVREIEMGNSMPITVSLGVGIGGATLAKTTEYAQAAVDLALGRGGDQAVIKEIDKITFFGGSSLEAPSDNRITARIKLWALEGLIEVAGNIIIMGHRNMDMDCFGAAIGIGKLVANKGRGFRILMGAETESIAPIYEVFGADADYRDIFINEETALRGCDEDTLLIIVDANRPGMMESAELLSRAGKLVVLDHHRLSADFIKDAALVYQEPFASSACELVCEMAQHLKEPLKWKPAEADALLAGITVDTKNFVQKTGVKTFNAAAYLRRNGADGIRVKMYLQEDLDSVLAMARTLSNVKIVGNFAFSMCEGAAKPIQAAARAADELCGVEGVHASFVAAPIEMGTEAGTYISARSLGKVNVQLVMEALGGGGHQTMAAVTLNTDINSAKQALFAILNFSEKTP